MGLGHTAPRAQSLSGSLVGFVGRALRALRAAGPRVPRRASGLWPENEEAATGETVARPAQGERRGPWAFQSDPRL